MTEKQPLTVERAREICELHAFKMDISHYLDPHMPCGCAITLRMVDKLGGVEELRAEGYTDENLDNYDAVAEVLEESREYVVGLEHGFEAWEIPCAEEEYGVDPYNPEFLRGVREGVDLGNAYDNNLIPNVDANSDSESWFKERRIEDRDEILAEVESLEAAARGLYA